MVKNNGTHGKVLSQGIFMWNIRALALTIQKLLTRLKFQRGGQNDRMSQNDTEWQTGQKQYAPQSLISGALKDSWPKRSQGQKWFHKVTIIFSS